MAATIKTDKTSYTPHLNPHDPPGNTPTGVHVAVTVTGAAPGAWFGVVPAGIVGWPADGTDGHGGNTVDWKMVDPDEPTQVVVVPTHSRGENYGGPYEARVFAPTPTGSNYAVVAKSALTVTPYSR